MGGVIDESHGNPPQNPIVDGVGSEPPEGLRRARRCPWGRRRVATLVMAGTGFWAGTAGAQTDAGAAPPGTVPVLPRSAASGAWIGALTGGAAMTGLLLLYNAAGCEDDDGCLSAMAIGTAAGIGGAAGGFVGQVVGTGIGTYHQWGPAAWLQGGGVRGADRSDPGSMGWGGRVGVLASMTPVFSGGFEFSRFSAPVRSERAWCMSGCDAPGDPLQVSGTLASFALVERADLPVAGPLSVHLVLGLGLAWQAPEWTLVDGEVPPGQVIPNPSTEFGPHLSFGGGLDLALSGGLRATGEVRLDPSWGWEAWTATLGLAYR